MDARRPAKLPAHRPSRRQEIVDAAIEVFSRNGFAETSIQDVADEAGVVPTAVYYHFSGKEELFDVVLQSVIAELDEVVERARPQGDQARALPRVVDAVWQWIEARPDHARVLYSHLPGATEQARQLRVQFEEQHIERAYVYARAVPTDQRRHGSDAAQHAATRLAVRTLIHTLMAIHPMRLDGGPLSRRSPRALHAALDEVSMRIVGQDLPAGR
ncbi:TetR family transcriptional regulator [Modestobacter sp. I12A-02628]|uniref:TetR/AcrR family transcriptional regulator n=1 Tax=Goekera deserti TaxID=2497753 RepID=A0A7K3WGF2_9ACTN|nr:TetR family transcriptional regulator [Goekera deserti]NDI47154.1 TetR family transcriptional regulator [Goekera deserti]NEL55446.1 TetR/AcrR family transcriptional regulator [Goekera deserti]